MSNLTVEGVAELTSHLNEVYEGEVFEGEWQNVIGSEGKELSISACCVNGYIVHKHHVQQVTSEIESLKRELVDSKEQLERCN